MAGQSLKLQRRAAITALLASLVFLVCLAAFAAANRISYAALNPPIDLHPLLERLRPMAPPVLPAPLAQRDGAHAALDLPFGFPSLVESVDGPEGRVFVGRGVQAGYQRVLEQFVPAHREIAAAIIAGLNGRVWAACPGRDEQIGRASCRERV